MSGSPWIWNGELLDAAHAVFLHVAGDDAENARRRSASSVRGTPMVQVQRGHRFVGGYERLLVLHGISIDQVEEERVLLRQTVLRIVPLAIFFKPPPGRR